MWLPSHAEKKPKSLHKWLQSPACFIVSLASFPTLLLLSHHHLSSSQKPVCCSPNMTFAVFPLPGMFFPRIHPANSIIAFESLFKSHLFNENYPLTLFKTQSFPISKWQFQSPSQLYLFLFFIELDLLCHLLILLIHYCLSSLLESKL